MKIVGFEKLSDIRFVSFDEISNIILYPKPAKEIINLSVPKNTSGNIKDYSIDRKLLYDSNYFNEGFLQVNIKNWANGTNKIFLNSIDGKIFHLQFTINKYFF